MTLAVLDPRLSMLALVDALRTSSAWKILEAAMSQRKRTLTTRKGSSHTDKEWIQAALNMPRDAEGAIIYPTIISRKPRRSDVHPVSPAALRKRMPVTKLEYLYGLRRIELRARRSDQIGDPFGCYLFRERTVVLYSLPLVWTVDRLSDGWRAELTAYGARVHKDDKGIRVYWPDEAHLDLWFWDQVFIHELGHHFVEQYQDRNGRVRRRSAHEGLANLHVGRYLNRRAQRVRSRIRELEVSIATMPRAERWNRCGKGGPLACQS